MLKPLRPAPRTRCLALKHSLRKLTQLHTADDGTRELEYVCVKESCPNYAQTAGYRDAS